MLMTTGDLAKAAQEHKDKMDRVFEYDAEHDYLTMRAAYPYGIELSRIPDMEALLHWVEHLSSKTWMTGELVREFIRRVCAIKGWDIHRRRL